MYARDIDTRIDTRLENHMNKAHALNMSAIDVVNKARNLLTHLRLWYPELYEKPVTTKLEQECDSWSKRLSTKDGKL